MTHFRRNTPVNSVLDVVVLFGYGFWEALHVEQETDNNGEKWEGREIRDLNKLLSDRMTFLEKTLTFVQKDVYWEGHLLRMIFVERDVCRKGRLSIRTSVGKDVCREGRSSEKTFVEKDVRRKGRLSRRMFIEKDMFVGKDILVENGV